MILRPEDGFNFMEVVRESNGGALYAGSQPFEGNLPTLINVMQISVFINLRREAQYNHVLEKVGFYQLPDPVYWQIGITDGEAPTIPDARVLTIAIDEWLAQGRKIYMHCHVGCGRCPSVVAAYLIKSEGYTLELAVKKIKAGMCAGQFQDFLPPQKEFLARWQNLYGRKI